MIFLLLPILAVIVIVISRACEYKQPQPVLFTGGGKEYEAKFLDINVEEVRQKIKDMGGQEVHPRSKYYRTMYTLPADKAGVIPRGYARVRDEAGNVTMTVKRYKDADDKFPDESEINLAKDMSIENGREFFKALGLTKQSTQETYREKYKLPDNPDVHELVIDEIPGFRPYLEIDCTSESTLNTIIEKLNLDEKNKRYGPYGKLYMEFYGIPESEINSIPELKFDTAAEVLKPLIRKNNDMFESIIGGTTMLHVSEPWFSLIKNGKKTIEGRLNRDPTKYKVGDTLIIKNKDTIELKITALTTYKSFKEMLEKEGLDKVLPDESVKTIEDGINIYYKFYKPEDEEKYGVIAIQLSA